MRILQITPPWIETPPREYGGTELIVSVLTENLIKMGHQVTLFATKDSRTKAQLKYLFSTGLYSQGINRRAALPTLIQYHRGLQLGKKGKYDLVHLHPSSTPDLAMLPLIAEAQIPTLMTLHSPWPLDHESHMTDHYLKYYGKGLAVVNISKSMAKITPKQFWKAGVVYNSLELHNFKFEPKPGKYLTWLGKILPKKGTYEAIMVAKQTGEQLIFAGVVDSENQDSIDYFRKKVKPLIDGKQIKYLGSADLKLKNKLLAGAKGFLNPIDWEEPFGLVMVEAMACGTPVISFARGAAKELIKNKKTGFLVKDRIEMKRAIKQLDTIDRAACRHSVEERFAGEVMTKNYLEIYQKVIRKFDSR